MGVFFQLGTEFRLGVSPPPNETLTIEHVRVTDGGFAIKIRADSPEPLILAQVMVDDAYWVFTQDPPGPLARMETATVTIDFPWVADEVHHMRFVTSLGSTFDHTVDVALKTPELSWQMLADFTLVGLLVGLVPIALGMLFFPAIKSLPPQGLEFILALTIGLLGYLFVDMVLEGLEMADESSAIFGGPTLVIIPLILTTVALLAIGSRSPGDRSGLQVAVLIALGIGLHNFGEGLAIGAAFAANKVSLGAFLIIGFALHNTTEGVGVVSPLVKERVTFLMFAGLALLAGLPVVPGIWLGALVLSPHWAALFFGVGAGAVLQVIIEINRFLKTRTPETDRKTPISATSVAGYCAGVAIMYGTALMISI